MSVADEYFLLELRTRSGYLLTQWAIPVGEDASGIDVNAEIEWLRSPFYVQPIPAGTPDPERTNADAVAAGDS